MSSLVIFRTMWSILTSVDLDQTVMHFFELRDSVSYSMVLNIIVNFLSDIPYSIGITGQNHFSDLSKVDNS